MIKAGPGIPTTNDGADSRVFRAITSHPWMILCCMLLAIFAMGLPLTSLQQDTRADAFLDADNPALRYREIVKEQFGLSDPYYIAIIDYKSSGIYNPVTLNLLAELTSRVSGLENVDSARVVSLATADNITGSDEGLTVQPFIDSVPIAEEEVERIKSEVADFPLYRDSLVGPSEKGTLIVTELFDESASEETYRQIIAIVDLLDLPEGVEVHVAGEGAIAGYLGAYIDADARRLIPLAGIIVLLVISLAFRRVLPALMALVIVLASVIGSLGLMALSGVPFYVVTNALPVILVGISVADAIHIFGHFDELQAEQTEQQRLDLVVQTMREMWRPVTATSLTTAAGFLGLYFASDMPPFRYFGLFSALGVMIAWLYSMIFLPAAMALAAARTTAVASHGTVGKTIDIFSRFMSALGRVTLSHSFVIACAFALLALVGGYAASQLVLDGNRIELFDPLEPIYVADEAINEYLYGTNTLDIVVEAREPEGLLDPANLRKIEALQQYLETLPHVTGSTSIVDYLKQMNRVLNSGDASAYVIPKTANMAAQYFLLYSMTADPSDFEEEVDYDYRMANVRATIDGGSYLDIAPIVESVETYLNEVFNSDDIRATQSGRVTLNYNWVKSVGEGHFSSLIMALLLVYAIASLLYRSLIAGLYAMIPVGSSVLCVYAFMVLSGMTLEIGTSMFAAVSIGLGVDFAIHTLDRMRVLKSETRGDYPLMFTRFYASTGRALLFNALAMGCGFGVLLFSNVSQLSDFGSVVVVSMLVSFISSMTLVPAILLMSKPKFLD